MVMETPCSFASNPFGIAPVLCVSLVLTYFNAYLESSR